ncbi:hypothetical protein A8924_3111 [Saccharopolyspora erythraea NRRL 2338]|uniref:Uncharacterized protein n=1 Tax=Saccharopolyspora erythraea (strain ATCC 11635 / DSM 40517 / JCM 4748 / NBRC 13426 / NCIMB 8594 / NRRL 2338) TaxID=405948 RepID=A4FD76_SACEN|nr:hypothetical protein N599_24780 [Saccharopolyspora erythraea D]PFG95747.1 hypothetical protein A8924_3111 [Saccharopolyspora erythraea NRRL 2338]CAM02001.1 hypothetical protein SACE_2720 [Saccharopolyspora erythraea NRRL 2338]
MALSTVAAQGSKRGSQPRNATTMVPQTLECQFAHDT